jgi:hypothetical protein
MCALGTGSPGRISVLVKVIAAKVGPLNIVSTRDERAAVLFIKRSLAAFYWM